MIQLSCRFSRTATLAAFTVLSVAAFQTAFFQKASAQSITGTVLGTVTDASGAVVSGAKVAAKNVATGVALSTSSNSEGNYTIPNVQPGTYDISAQMDGFNTATASKNVVEVQQTKPPVSISG